jgi:hypothetical protein
VKPEESGPAAEAPSTTSAAQVAQAQLTDRSVLFPGQAGLAWYSGTAEAQEALRESLARGSEVYRRTGMASPAHAAQKDRRSRQPWTAHSTTAISASSHRVTGSSTTERAGASPGPRLVTPGRRYTPPREEQNGLCPRRSGGPAASSPSEVGGDAVTTVRPLLMITALPCRLWSPPPIAATGSHAN